MRRLIVGLIVSASIFQAHPLVVDCSDNDTYLSEEIQQICNEVGDEYGICPELLMSVIEHESSGNPKAVSPGGCLGLMQIDPRWHKERMERLGVTDLCDPEQNILTGTDYLMELAEEYGDLYLVLMHYNMTHSKAQELWNQGKYTKYALSISARSAQLERAHGK